MKGLIESASMNASGSHVFLIVSVPTEEWMQKAGWPSHVNGKSIRIVPIHHDEGDDEQTDDAGSQAESAKQQREYLARAIEDNALREASEPWIPALMDSLLRYRWRPAGAGLFGAGGERDREATDREQPADGMRDPQYPPLGSASGDFESGRFDAGAGNLDERDVSFTVNADDITTLRRSGGHQIDFDPPYTGAVTITDFGRSNVAGEQPDEAQGEPESEVRPPVLASKLHQCWCGEYHR